MSVQIINELQGRQNPLGQALGMGLGQMGQRIQQQQKQQHQSGILSRVLSGEASPEELSQLDPNAQMEVAKLQQNRESNLLKNQFQQEKLNMERTKEQEKLNQKIVPFQEALSTVERMREIGKEGRLGKGSGFKGMFGGETSRDRGEYEQLGKSLISYASTIPIRNKAEFEALAEKIYDPSKTDKEREGILSAMERIIRGTMAQYIGPKNAQQFGNSQQQNPQYQQEAQQPSGERPPLTSFYKK